MPFIVIFSIMLSSFAAQAVDLQLVSSVRYEDLRGRLKNLAPNHDYGDRRVEIWADIESDCFQGTEDVLGAFGDWLDGADLPGFPGAVEIRCKTWTDERSVVVITQFGSRQRPPHHLWVFSSSSNGAHLADVLVDESIGSSLLVGYRTDFIVDRGRVTGILAFRQFPERSDREDYYPEWLSTRVYLLKQKTRRVSYDVLAAYRLRDDVSTSFALLTRGSMDGAPTWTLRIVGPRDEAPVTAKLDIGSESLSKNSNQVEPTIEAFSPVLDHIAKVTSSETAVTLFESKIVTSYLQLHKPRMKIKVPKR